MSTFAWALMAALRWPAGLKQLTHLESAHRDSNSSNEDISNLRPAVLNCVWACFRRFFRAIARFGYKDVTDVGDQFAADVVNAIYRVFHYDPSNRSAHGGKVGLSSILT